jgi:pyridoxamine 5'-phosphate oxidase
MIGKEELASLRRSYASKTLTKASVAADPFHQFSVWLDEALRSEIIDANAMTLATSTKDGRPSARVVLLKSFDKDGFVFYTNYKSKKAQDLAANPYASLHFFWPQLERQIEICGTVGKVSREESIEYFASRPPDSQLGAWASNQSSQIPERKVLEEQMAQLKTKYDGAEIPCPEFWGGFRLVPDSFEFWQGRASRLHDRICYERKDEGWEIIRLSP